MEMEVSFLSQIRLSTRSRLLPVSLVFAMVFYSSYSQLVLLDMMRLSLTGYNAERRENSLSRPDKINATIITSRREPFRPFEDLVIDLSQQQLENNSNDLDQDASTKSHKSQTFTSHRCASHITDEITPSYVGRTCIFSNVYYEPSAKAFHYFASPQESRLYKDAQELQETITVASGYYFSESTKKRNDDAMKFAFTAHLNETIPKSALTVVIRDKPHTTIPTFLLYHMSYSFNPGHILWDDILSFFTMLDFFQLASERDVYQPVPLHMGHLPDPFYRCNPPKFRWDICGKMVSKLYPSLSGVDVVSKENGDAFRVGNAFADKTLSSSMIRLPLVIAGQGRLAEYGCSRAECATHWTGRLYRFRQWTLENIFGGERQAAIEQNVPATHITVALPVGNSHEGVLWFEDIIPALQQQFGNETVRVVDFASLSLQDQARLAIATKVLLINAGGGSMTATFLPRGSTIILFHPGSWNDATFYNAQGYINVVWQSTADNETEKILDYVQVGLERESIQI